MKQLPNIPKITAVLALLCVSLITSVYVFESITYAQRNSNQIDPLSAQNDFPKPRGEKRSETSKKASASANNGTRAAEGMDASQHQLGAQALNVLSAGNSFYSVHVEDSVENGVGLYTVTTGPDHPAGSELNALYGIDSQPGTSFNTIHSYTSLYDYIQITPEELPTNVTALSLYGTISPLGTTGFRVTYELPGPPLTSDRMTIVTDINVKGTTYQDSSVEVKTEVINTSDVPIEIGIRYLWDTQIGEDDGPTLQEINPDGATSYTTEQTFSAPLFESYEIAGNDVNTGTSSSPFVVYGTVSGPPILAPTAPDLLQFVCWSGAINTYFREYEPGNGIDITTNGVDCEDDATQGGDSAVMYFFGSEPENAISIAPGESHSVSASLIATEPPEFFINLSPSSTILAAQTEHTLIATVVDDQEQPVEGMTVTFLVDGVNNDTQSGTTNPSGQLGFMYRGELPGPDVVTAWVDRNEDEIQDPTERSDSAFVEWIELDLELEPETAINDAGTSHTVTATVLELSPSLSPTPSPTSVINLIQDRPIVVEVSGANLLTEVITSTVSGQATFTYSGDNVGVDSITAWIDLIENGQQDPIEPSKTVTKTWRQVYNLSMSISDPSPPVGRSITVSGILVDHKNDPLVGVPMSIVAPRSGFQATQSTDGEGRVVFEYVGLSVGSEEIQLWTDLNQNGLQDDDGATQSQTIFWEAVNLILDVNASALDVGSTAYITAGVYAEVRGSVPVLGPLQGYAVGFQVGPINPGGATETSDSDGLANFSYVGTNNQSGVDTVTAWVDLDRNGTIGGFEPTQIRTITWSDISVSMYGSGVGTDLEAIRTVTATVTNNITSPVTNVNVGFEVSNGNQHGPEMLSVNSQGQAVFTYTSLNPDASTVRASNFAPLTHNEIDESLAIDAVDTIMVWVDLIANGRYDEGAEPFDLEEAPSAIRLVFFGAQSTSDNRVILTWQTATESDTAGFNLYRATNSSGPFDVPINDKLIGAEGSESFGATYTYTDTPNGEGPFYYLLEDIELGGAKTRHGPVMTASVDGLTDGSADLTPQIYVPLVR